MANIGFIGVGNMGAPMAINLLKAGHKVTAFDLNQLQLDQVAKAGAVIANTASAAGREVGTLITMLPTGKHVKDVLVDELFGAIPAGTLIIDCSTIDVESSRIIHKLAIQQGLSMLDAPVSGGVGGASAGTLTFMVGGTEEAYTEGLPILQDMGKNIVHCGNAGTGQAAKICNNMMLGIQMASVAEAFVLGERLGLDTQKLFDVASTASGQCWSLTSYCPVPGPVPGSPANRDYEPGFATALMLKDMMLALVSAKSVDVNVNVAKIVASLYQSYSEQGNAGKDFSGILNMIRN
ncbi:MAG: 3-hydroxyisobutyrate dehydrogenase [Gammaproteobacteria bacterium]|nr:3-hydroxyisobutyrate dehydrogenase [Gammaproteobacteria bacterium]